MIALIEGIIISIDPDDGLALVKVGQVGYQIMLPAYCISELSSKVGSEISLRTMEYYEGTLGGGNLIPRLVGFQSLAERDFFTKITSVKGVGIKKALRCLTIPIATIALAIEENDEKILSTLPGIGKRTAQLIIAELKGKLQSFTAGAQITPASIGALKAFQAEALEILIAWGEKRNCEKKRQ